MGVERHTDSAVEGRGAAAVDAAVRPIPAGRSGKPLRVLFIAPQPFFRERGTPLRARNILRALSEAGCQVDVLCYPFGDPLELPGLRIIRSPRVPGIQDVRVGPSFAKVPLGALMSLRAFWLCLRNRYDVIHAVEEAAFFAVALKSIFGCKFVYNLDSFISEHLEYSGFVKAKPVLQLARVVERVTIRGANIGVTVGQDISAKVRIISPRTTVLQLEDAPLNDTFDERKEEADAIRGRLQLGAAPVILYAGNFGGYQGIDLLIRAAACVGRVRPDVRFVLVGGDAETIPAMTGLAESLGTSENCIFTGRRPTPELGAYLTMANFLVSPRTQGTNTPLKIYDYMQSGRPIIATNLLTHTQVLDESCAMLTAPEPEAFASGILRLLNDSDLGTSLAAAAARRLDETYALPIFKRKVQTAYQRLWPTDLDAAHVADGAPGSQRV
jgi:glycosyltransferase involved in cell wall biosynthesis